MSPNFTGSVFQKEGLFRSPDTGGSGAGSGAGGGKDDDSGVKKPESESLNFANQMKVYLKEIKQLMEDFSFPEAKEKVEEARKLIADSRQSLPEDEQWQLSSYSKALLSMAKNIDSNYEEGVEKLNVGLEKQARHEVLLERMKKQFSGIDKYLQISKKQNVNLTEDEARDLIIDLKAVFDEFIDSAVRTNAINELGAEIQSKRDQLEAAPSDIEEDNLNAQINKLSADLQNPFTYLPKSGFTDEQLKPIREQYKEYCEQINQLIGLKNPNEEQRINRAKQILDSDEALNFMQRLRQLGHDSKKMSPAELRSEYADLMSGWSELGIRPKIFSDIASVEYQAQNGQTLSGESTHKQYKDFEKLRFDIERQLTSVKGEFRIFNFREIADEIKKSQLDFFRFADRRNPSNELDEHKDYLDGAFKYWSFGSVFNNEYVVADTISSLFDVFSNKINLETKQTLSKSIFELFKRIHDGQATNADELIASLKDQLGVTKDQAEKWLVEAYKKVGALEVERIEIKTDLQTFFMDNVMQIDGAAAGDRSRLKECLETYLVGRNELLLATTYHPEYGWLVRKLLQDLQATAVLDSDEVVVKRLVKKQNLYAFSEVVPSRDDFDFKETLQRVVAQPQDRVDAGQLRVPVAEFLKAKLEEAGETVVYLPDHKNNLINYNSLSHSEKGRANLKTAIDVLISNIKEGDEFKDKDQLNKLSEDNLNKAKMFASRLFTIFNSLDIVLTEKQKNTTTRAHNGGIEDIDRISLIDPEASMVHRQFRYPGNYSEATAEILAVMSPINAEHNLYPDKRANKNFVEEQSFMYSELDGNGKLKVEEKDLKVVHPDYIYQLGKKGDERNGKFMRADAMQLATVQRMQWDFYEQFFPIINKMPLIRRRGFLEPLGFSTNQILFLNPTEWERTRSMEKIWDYIHGSVNLDKNGKVIIGNEIKAVEDILKPSKARENITELQHYNTAEKNGFLGVLERMYARTSSGGKLSTDQLFSSNKSILHEWFSAWGRIKMYPSPIVRDAFVPMTYLMIRRAVTALECISGKTANYDEGYKVWKDVINTLESNLRDGGGLDSYGEELATVINLLCDKPAYRIDYSDEDSKRKFKRCGRFKFEEPGIGDYKADDYSHLPVVGPKPGDFTPIKNRKSAKINYAISRFLYESILKTKPYVKVSRPEIRYNFFTDRRREALLTEQGINWKLIEEHVKGRLGDFSTLKVQLLRTLHGESGGIDAGSVISRKGDPLVQVKEDKK